MSGPLWSLPIDAHLVALLALPGMGPARLNALLASEPNPARLWTRLVGGWSSGRPPIPGVVIKADMIWEGWVDEARRLDAAVFSAVGFGDLHGAMDEGESRVGHRRAMGEGVAEEFVAGGFRLDRGIGEEPPSRGLGGSASNPFCRSGPIP